VVLEGFLLKGGLLHPRLRVVSQLSRLLHHDPINLLEDVPQPVMAANQNATSET